MCFSNISVLIKNDTKANFSVVKPSFEEKISMIKIALVKNFETQAYW